MKLLQSSGSQDEDAKSRKKKKKNRGLEKLYGKAATGGQYGKSNSSNPQFLLCPRALLPTKNSAPAGHHSALCSPLCTWVHLAAVAVADQPMMIMMNFE